MTVKDLTICGHYNHFGHVPSAVQAKFHSAYLLGLHV